MKRLEILLVRLAPIVITLYLVFVIIFAYQGESLYEYNYILGHSLYVDFTLLILSYNNKHYHCSYNRALIYNLLAVDILGFLDTKFSIINDAETQLTIICTFLGIASIISIYYAIKHFYKVNKSKINNIVCIIELLFKTIYKNIYGRFTKQGRC